MTQNAALPGIGARESASRLCYGTLPFGPLQRELPPERGAELLAYAFDRGVRLLDTAEYYHTYPHVYEALRARPGYLVCTKSYAYDLDGAKRSVEMAQEGIGRERIDVFLLHEQESEHTLRGHASAYEYYLSLRERGVIGAVGVSTHRVAGAEAAAVWRGMDVVFPLLNIAGLGITDGTEQDMERAAAKAHANGRFVLAMKALGGGHLIASREEALRYVFELPFVDAVAVGMQSEAEIEFNLALAEGRTPPEDAAEASARAPRTLIVQPWCQGCGKCVKRCGQGALALDSGRAQVDLAKCVRCGYCAAACPEFCLKVI